jgi:hypothetical protein
MRVDVAAIVQVRQQAVEQQGIASRFDRQMQIGDLAGGGLARIDDDDLEIGILFFGLADALVNDGMAPGGVRADQDDQGRQFQVLVIAGHRIAAEGALMAGDAGGHAQARVGVDVGRTDKALHELVGDVIIFREQLAGNIKRHAVGAVLADCAGEAVRHGIQRRVPVASFPPDFGMQQALGMPQGFAERGALGAQTPEIRGVFRIAANFRRPVGSDGREHAAPDAAIGAGGSDRSIHYRFFIENPGVFSNPRATHKAQQKQSYKSAMRNARHQVGTTGSGRAPVLCRVHGGITTVFPPATKEARHVPDPDFHGVPPSG